jgi:hypothetical protein
VREERLRATAGLRQTPLALSSWRGRSGRRYIVGVHPLEEADVLEVTDAVILAVRRDDDGTARVIDIATAGSQPVVQARTRWMVTVREQGATEVHVHRLADGEAERRAIIDDLREDETAARESAARP